MKRSLGTRVNGILFGALALLFVSAGPVFAAESIRRFDVQASLQSDRTLTITETIEYDFGDGERHGIYRDIPVRYSRDGATYRLRLDVGDSTMNGQPVPQDISTVDDDLRIRLGDPNVLVTGRKTYVIRYRTNRAINDFPALDKSAPGGEEREFYWNVTGDRWDVPIERASITINGPAEPTQTICFTGERGSTEQACTIKKNGSIVVVEARRRFDSREGLTVAIRYSGDAIQGLSWQERAMDLVRDNIWFLFPPLTFLIMFLYWNRFGKEPKGRGTVVAQYEEPQNLPPGLLAALLEQELSQKAITGTLLDLARRGYMKIRIDGDPSEKGWFKKKATYTFIKLKESEGLTNYEEELFDGLFDIAEEVKLEDKKDGSFWKTVQGARHKAFEQLQSRKLFGRNPALVRSLWLAIAAGVAATGVLVSVYIVEGFIIVSTVISGLIVALFGWQMPRMTKEGAVVAEEAEGFKLFLSVTEKDRLNFTDAPERKPDQFARFLPAAVAFGVEEKWAKQFSDLMIQPPSYIEGSAHGWSAGQFVGAISSMHAASASSMYHAPSSGGSGVSGGSSGGGGGGGGGGSW